MSGQFARLRGALDRVGTTTPGTIVGVFAEDLTAIMNHYVEVVREAAELKAARAQPAQAGRVLSNEEIDAVYIACRIGGVQDFARAIEQSVLSKRVPQWLPIETAPQDWGVTKFDVWANDARFADCWWGKATYEQGEPGIVYQSDYDCNGPVDSYVRNATHWMPLPPPPGIVGKEGA